MSTERTTPETCGCCEGPGTSALPGNDPGLDALAWRIDRQPGFLARMLPSLPLAPADRDAAEAARPLARLLTRAGDDPSVALLDAAACVADVLTFYHERIANEGFLRTATERRSVLELARATSYELKPGVAASVHLAFEVEDARGAPGICRIAAGTPVQSVPPQGKLPQVFETAREIVAHAAWNALKPRQTRPADMAILDVPAGGGAPARRALALLGLQGSFPGGTPGLAPGLLAADLFRLDPGLAVDQRVDALEVGRIHVTEAAGAGIAGGDLLLFVGKRGTALSTLVLRATAVLAEPALGRIRIDVEPLPDPVPDPAPPPPSLWVVPYVLTPVMALAKPQVTAVQFTAPEIASKVVAQSWRESDLQAMIGIQGWSATVLTQAATAPKPAAPPLAPEAGAFAFGARLGFFGHNAPRWKMLPPKTDSTHGDAYPQGWDVGDGALTAQRTVWEDSQGNPTAPRVFLERAVPDVTRASWVVFDAPDVPDVAAQPFSVLDSREVSRADFGISGRAMQLRLAAADGGPLPDAPPAFRFRSSSAHVASRRLGLADLPIDAPIRAGDDRVELDRLVLGLGAGQPVALTGERADLPGVAAAEIAVIADVVHTEGRSTLHFDKGLAFSYVRASLRINANVARATHGETIREVLGSGDATFPNQRFTLRKPPTTHLSSADGAASTLEIRVGGVLWEERPSLFGAGPDEPVYMARIGDDGATTLIFGDGLRGARLPSGTLNVSAVYRSGLGPDGEVAAGTLTMLRAVPLGLRGVTNPLAASGGEGPERLADARHNAPLSLLAFDRVVSLVDYESQARAFPGIGKARAEVLWTEGAARVVVTVTGATGGVPGPELLADLTAAIAKTGDPGQRFAVAGFAPRFFSLRARVAVDPRHLAADVLPAVSTALVSGLGFAARELAQSVTAAEVVALIHAVPGVVAVDLDELLAYGADPPPSPGPPPAAVPAFGAGWDRGAREPRPAELLLLNPAGLGIEEMPP